MAHPGLQRDHGREWDLRNQRPDFSQATTWHTLWIATRFGLSLQFYAIWAFYVYFTVFQFMKWTFSNNIKALPMILLTTDS